MGGKILEAVLSLINIHARIPVCGMIAAYNATEPLPGPYNLGNLIIKRARMEGFLVTDYAHRFPEALVDLRAWLKNGQLQSQLDIVDGLENTPQTFNRLFDGSNQGKLIIRVSEDPTS